MRPCLNELRINTRTAPQLYLEVVPISREAGREIASFAARAGWWSGCWSCADSIKRRLYDRWRPRGGLPVEAMGALAGAIAALHARADRVLTQDQAVQPLRGDHCRPRGGARGARSDVLRRGAAQQLARDTRARIFEARV